MRRDAAPEPSIPSGVGTVARLDRNERTASFDGAFLSRALRALASDDLTRYPDVPAVRAQLARLMQVDPETLVVCAGSDAGIRAVFEVCLPLGGSVLLAEPSYHGYAACISRRGAVVRSVTLSSDQPPAVASLVTAIEPGVDLIVLQNPCGTGMALPRRDVLAIARRAAEVRATLLVDEAYHGFGAASVVADAAGHDNMIISRSFSKAFGLAGVRLGLLASNARLTSALEQTRISRDVSGLAARLVPFVAVHGDVAAYAALVEAERERFVAAARSMGLRALDSVANFVLVQSPANWSAIDLRDHCRERGVLIAAGFGPPFERFVRISVGTPAEMARVAACLSGAVKAAR